MTAAMTRWLAVAATVVLVGGCLGKDDTGGGGGGTNRDSGRDTTGLRDSAFGEGGFPDLSEPDSGQPDFGQPDFGQPDSGQPDSGQPDFGQPDFGQPDFGQPGCGTVPELGECDGLVLSFCDVETEEVVTVDCQDYFSGLADATCAMFSGGTEADCAVREGEACAFVTTDDQDFTAACLGSQPSCVLDSEGSACRTNVGTCTSLPPGNCSGNLLALDCGFYDQPITVDCVAFGGSCELGTGCVDLPEGALCGGVLQCGTGLVCDGETDTTLGTCAPG